MSPRTRPTQIVLNGGTRVFIAQPVAAITKAIDRARHNGVPVVQLEDGRTYKVDAIREIRGDDPQTRPDDKQPPTAKGTHERNPRNKRTPKPDSHQRAEPRDFARARRPNRRHAGHRGSRRGG